MEIWYSNVGLFFQKFPMIWSPPFQYLARVPLDLWGKSFLNQNTMLWKSSSKKTVSAKVSLMSFTKSSCWVASLTCSVWVPKCPTSLAMTSSSLRTTCSSAWRSANRVPSLLTKSNRNCRTVWKLCTKSGSFTRTSKWRTRPIVAKRRNVCFWISDSRDSSERRRERKHWLVSLALWTTVLRRWGSVTSCRTSHKSISMKTIERLWIKRLNSSNSMSFLSRTFKRTSREMRQILKKRERENGTVMK